MNNGWSKLRSLDEHTKISQNRLLWRKIENQQISIFDYLDGIAMSYDFDDVKLEEKFGVASWNDCS